MLIIFMLAFQIYTFGYRLDPWMKLSLILITLILCVQCFIFCLVKYNLVTYKVYITPCDQSVWVSALSFMNCTPLVKVGLCNQMVFPLRGWRLWLPLIRSCGWDKETEIAAMFCPPVLVNAGRRTCFKLLLTNHRIFRRTRFTELYISTKIYFYFL